MQRRTLLATFLAALGGVATNALRVRATAPDPLPSGRATPPPLSATLPDPLPVSRPTTPPASLPPSSLPERAPAARVAAGDIAFYDPNGGLTGNDLLAWNSATRTLNVGSGTSQHAYNAWPAHRIEVTDGTPASPETTAGPTVKLSRTESDAIYGGNAVDNESNATLAVYSAGTATTQMQSAAIYAHAENASPHVCDAVALYGDGRITGGGTGIATGLFASGRRDTQAAKVKGAEFNASDFAGNSSYNPNGFSDVTGVWVSYLGNPGSVSGAAVSVGVFPNAGEFAVGYAVTAKSVANEAFRDDSNATTSIRVNGTHANALDTTGAHLDAIINAGAAQTTPTAGALAGYLLIAVDGKPMKVPYYLP